MDTDDRSYTKETPMATINEGQSSKNKFPFDMNNLFNMQYSFDQLKLAIEYLAKQQSD